MTEHSADRANRATSFSPPERFLLNQWGEILRRAFRAMPYLVGSSAFPTREPRDVDVRLMLDDADPLLRNPARLRVLNVAMSLWGRQATGLPIDFQFQSETEGNADPNSGKRIPLFAHYEIET